MPDDRVLAIAARLLQLTTAELQRWQAVAPPEDAEPEWMPAEFGTRMELGGAVISSRAPEGRYPYDFALYDLAGVEVGRLETGSDADSWFGDGEADAWEVVLQDLYAAARASAVDVDAALDGMLSELQRREG